MPAGKEVLPGGDGCPVCLLREGKTVKKSIYTGIQGNCHIQGIAVDTQKGFIYYSFTTKLIKSTLDGKIVGSVDGLVGHLGCIDFREADGKVYGSLEFKNDSIGKGIRKNLGVDVQFDDAFYIAIFDVDKITRMDMDAEKDGVMTAAYLEQVVRDYHGTGKNAKGETVPHKYGCSGIDGTALGPMPGDKSGREYLFTAYGIYGDITREDNDYQILLCYDPEELCRTAKPLSQLQMHKSGPEKPLGRYFVYTGNTVYGVQNLEYDAFTHSYFMAVYRGKKEKFTNYDLFQVDASAAPEERPLRGTEETGLCFTLKADGERDANGLFGRFFEYGSTGLFAKGDGTYLISHPGTALSGQYGRIYSYKFTPEKGFVKAK